MGWSWTLGKTEERTTVDSGCVSALLGIKVYSRVTKKAPSTLWQMRGFFIYFIISKQYTIFWVEAFLQWREKLTKPKAITSLSQTYISQTSPVRCDHTSSKATWGNLFLSKRWNSSPVRRWSGQLKIIFKSTFRSSYDASGTHRWYQCRMQC